MLDLGLHLALASPWWSWDKPTIRKALSSSILVRLIRIGTERLKANENAGQAPSSWKAFAHLRKDAKSQERMFRGASNPCLELLLGYASLLKNDIRDYFPETKEWIAEATAYVSRHVAGPRQEVHIEEAKVYVEHVLPIVADGPLQTEQSVSDRFDMMPIPARTIVKSVAKTIAPALQTILSEKSPRSRKGNS